MDVLAAVDKRKQRAEEQAQLLTMFPCASELTVYICHVFERDEDDVAIDSLPSVQAMAERLEAADIEYEFRSRMGEPAEKIVESAAGRDVDAICLSGRKRSPAGKVLFGSVAQSVVLGTDRAVLMAGDREQMTTVS